MIRPIDANALKEAATTSIETTDAFIELIDKQPSLDYLPVKHAHWVGDIGRCQCSNCKSYQELSSRYCPYCGARMDEEAHR